MKKKMDNGFLFTSIISFMAISICMGTIKIGPWGDSITGQFEPGYRYNLVRKLLADPHKFSFMFTGKWCDSASSHPERVPAGLQAYSCQTGNAMADIGDILGDLDGFVKDKPDIGLLMGGTNDIGKHTSKQYADGLRNLLDQTYLKLPNIIMLVSSIPPKRNYADSVAKFNSLIPGIINEQKNKGRKVYFVDMTSKLTLADFPDGVHPGEVGSEKMAQAWYDALVPIMSNWPTTSTIKISENFSHVKVNQAFKKVYNSSQNSINLKNSKTTFDLYGRIIDIKKLNSKY